MTIGICTDSHAQLPTELVERFGVVVVPVTVKIGECEYLEGVDLGIDEFYDRLAGDAPPEVMTTCPSPGQFALAYDELAERGCSQILSVHAAHATGTLNAARLAAHSSPVPVRLVDTGARSFGVSCCVWAAGDAIAAGATLEEASVVAESLAPRIGNLFIVGALELLGRGPAGYGMGRDRSGERGVEVLSFHDDAVHVVDHVANAQEAVDSLCDHAVRWGDGLRVAVGTADCVAAPLSDALTRAIQDAPGVTEVISYRIGPSVAAHTGPGTISCCMFPAVPPPAG